MAKRTGPTNPNLKRLIRLLRATSTKEGAAIWRRVADDLERPTRNRREVNIARLHQVTQPREVVVVPGKVLAYGAIDHDLTVAAWRFSTAAKRKVKALTIEALLKANPKGKDVRIIG